MKKLLLLSIIFIANNVTSSYAADVIYHSPEAPAYDEASIWNGAYIGAQIGYDWNQNSIQQDFSVNNNGPIAGIYAGYNWEFSNNYLLGLEGDVNYTNLSKQSHYTKFGPTPPDDRDFIWSTQLQWEAALRMRFGINYGRALPYLAAGVSLAGVKNNNLAQEAPYISTDDNTTRVGYTLGAGLDYALTNNLLLRTEYRYSDYGSKSVFNDTGDFKLSTNSVRLGIAYKF
ncbi:outer membrane protein [Pseudochrobactrum sp. MP213Fo]|uniref:outer membrane protein n=1 Tax=Pseudochrobactrum sp. MP213Fo TaxID=3022250 RepID=UPI003B9E651C